jgi:ATP-binding cassette subfamily B protein/subfamily B ATP-binding cassette protein MsbA
VTFEGVSFGYEPGDPAIRDISFTAGAGQATAIVGITGAGKTSLVSLISRFYDPWEGRVLVDGHDIRDLSLKSLRENVALVLQDPYLFPMTVRENIAFGKPEATFDEVVQAATMARAHDFIIRLPSGYETVLAEKGGSLSGGERQRISIARAIIRDAPILILDEPTSSLDAQTESEIFDALTELIRTRTTFIVSHRLSTIRRADQIIVLEGGTIVERGSHDDLLSSGELYAHLYKLQVRAALEPSSEPEVAAGR